MPFDADHDGSQMEADTAALRKENAELRKQVAKAVQTG